MASASLDFDVTGTAFDVRRIGFFRSVGISFAFQTIRNSRASTSTRSPHSTRTFGASAVQSEIEVTLALPNSPNKTRNSSPTLLSASDAGPCFGMDGDDWGVSV